MPLQPFLDRTYQSYGDVPEVKPATVESVVPAQAGHAGEFLTTDGTNTSWAPGGGGGTPLPSQSGHAGEYLTTNGTTASWAAVDHFPAQSGQGGKFLKTDGTNVSWEGVSEVPPQSGNAGKILTTDGTSASWTMYMRKLTQAEYDALPQSEKINGTIYMIVG